MDFESATGIELRTVGHGKHDGRDVRVVAGVRTYATDIDDLWDAMTRAQRLKRWFSPVEGDLKEGGRYRIQDNASGTIERCEPPNVLDLTWEFGENVSWVSVRLEVVASGTRLTLEHKFTRDEAGEKHWQQYGPGATGVGWELAFMGLALHIDNAGEQVDHSAAEAWFGTPAGKAFIRQCASSWGDAHVASGANAKAAAAMAEQAAKFYAGE